jgi:hypothetical protein
MLTEFIGMVLWRGYLGMVRWKEDLLALGMRLRGRGSGMCYDVVNGV